MEATYLILKTIDDYCRERTLFDDWGCPSWQDGQFFSKCLLYMDRGNLEVWSDFQQRINDDRRLTLTIRNLLLESALIAECDNYRDVKLTLPDGVRALDQGQERSFLRSLNIWEREPRSVFARRLGNCTSPNFDYYETDNPARFLPPQRESIGTIMYVEMKPDLSGPARIGRVKMSNSGKTLYYDGKKLQSLKGSAYKANYFNVESGMWYWISKCRRDGNDSLYPEIVEIDDDAREEYWIDIRGLPENKHLGTYRSPGKHSKRRPC